MLPILILGASTRAAAHAALRAGLRPVCADLFGDRDLSSLCPTRIVPREQYPRGLARIAEDAPPSPWLYTGAIENQPDLVDQISRDRPLWGIGGDALRALRDPIAVAKTLRDAGLPVLNVRLDPKGLPRDGTWLVKPLASAGGQGIHPLVPDESPPSRSVYYQERIAGASLSAIFIGRREGAELLGVTRQWIGRAEAPFAYVGSVGPRPVSRPTITRIDALGRVLSSTFGLLGLFGVDFILRDGVPWLVEVNPRYTASVEVLELALGRSLLAEHCRVFEPIPEPPVPKLQGRPSIVGKLIVFARERCRMPDDLSWSPAEFRPWAIPSIADVPERGSWFARGEPVLTLLAGGPTAASCRERLLRERARWYHRLRDHRESDERSPPADPRP